MEGFALPSGDGTLSLALRLIKILLFFLRSKLGRRLILGFNSIKDKVKVKSRSQPLWEVWLSEFTKFERKELINCKSSKILSF
jgi:hypothetical protein